MKPLKLTLQAFGPFAKQEIIDFTKMGENPLFLVNGPTGCGKTSILDAISTALYGDTTGGERSSEQMRCHFSPADITTELSFEFQLGENRFRIQRNPKQEVKKSRGEGTTVKNATAELHQLIEDGSLKLLANKVNEVNAKITELLGMTDKQFRQVMIIPQGKFRDLLLADSNDREAIFQQLFQTHIYEQIQDAVAEKAKRVRALQSQANEKIKWQLEDIGVTTESELTDQTQSQQKIAEQLLKQKEATQQTAKSLQTQFDQATELLNQFNELGHFEKSLKTLEAQDPEMEIQREKIRQAQQAEKLQPILTQLKESEHQCLQQEKSISAKQQEITDAEMALQEAKVIVLNAEKAYESIPKLNNVKDTLTQLRPQLSLLNDLVKREQNKKQATQDSEILVNECEQKIIEMSNQVKNAQKDIENIETQLKQKPEWRIEAQKLESVVTDYQAYENLQKNIRSAAIQVEDAISQFQQIKTECDKQEQDVTRLEIAWHKGQAAELALKLEDDFPCPVCGSKEHPSPAQIGSKIGVVTKQQVDDARYVLNEQRETLKTANENLLKQQNNLENLQSKIDELTKKLCDFINSPIKHWQSKLAILQQNLSKLADLEDVLSDQKDALGRAHSELEITKEQKVGLKEAYDRFHAEHQQLVDQLNNTKNQIPKKYDSLKVLELEITHIEDQVQVLETAKENAKKEFSDKEKALNAYQSALNTMSQALEERKANLAYKLEQWNQVLDASPFASMQKFEAALLTEHESKTIVDLITTHDEQKTSIKGAIKTLAPKLERQSPPNILEINAKLEKANNDYSVVENELNEANQSLKEFTKAKNNIKQIRIVIKEFEDEYKTIGTLSEVLSGQGEGKVNLQRFVQGALLDDVLGYASNRLYQMSKGQFELKRKTEAARRGKASGLDLEVLDNHTGRCRDVVTLSGGESFMAALSLALGLSDVVQSYSGAIRLETLFIDEGFGSLDQDALEEVIEVFEQLQSNGRTIGIISHVSELKQQMPKRIDVIKNINGSNIKLIA